MFAWRNTDGDVEKKNWEKHCKAFLDSGDIEEALFRFWPIVRIYLVTDLEVKKDQAVLLLHEEGYPFVQEVKGLSSALVEKILHESSMPSQKPVEERSGRSTLITGMQIMGEYLLTIDEIYRAYCEGKITVVFDVNAEKSEGDEGETEEEREFHIGWNTLSKEEIVDARFRRGQVEQWLAAVGGNGKTTLNIPPPCGRGKP
jgi:hypothetical protein